MRRLPRGGDFNGSVDENFNGHTFGASLLFSSVLTDKVTFGAGFKLAYIQDKYDSDMTGFGASNGILSTGTESAVTDRDLTLNYRRFGPVLGISVKPSSMLTIDASLEAGFYVGDVEKESTLAQDFTMIIRPASDLYTEDLGSSDLNGWDLAAKVKPEIILSDAISVPLIVAFNYRDFRWNVDGTSIGFIRALQSAGRGAWGGNRRL